MERIHIWIGTFSSKEAFDDYLEEIYDEEDDDAPINQFAEDQNKTFYDHDWVESGFKIVDDLEELIKPHSYSEKYLEAALDQAESLGIESANSFIMADSGEFSEPQSKQTEAYSLMYLGRFTGYIR